jgi:predicted nucleotidyltransferase
MNLDIKTLRRALAEILERESHVLAAYHFGSTAAGTATPSSDIDVGVLFSTKVPLEELVRIEGLLDEPIPYPVDVVDVRRAGPFVALDVIRGDRFFCRDEVAADEFDLFVLRRAGDLEYYERQRREAFLAESTVEVER